jgi:hypothetical protein
MAPHPTANFVSPHNEEEDLSDEQVAALLKEAEDRLRLRRGDSGDSRSSVLRKPYVSQVLPADAHLLIFVTASPNSNMASKLPP